jgi:cyclopropane-fatty-acyl-phospholipid synthase
MIMALRAEVLPDAAPIEKSITFLERLFAHYPARDFQVRFWEGTTWGTENRPQFTLVLKHPGALRRIFRHPDELSMGEAYIYGAFDIEGDIEAAMSLSDALVQSDYPFAERLHLASQLRKLPSGTHRRPQCSPHLSGSVHSERRDRQAIAYHYNLPADFYRLFLDSQLVYSCAYFKNLDDDLDTAQIQKLDYLCRKLRLCPGDRLLDIGCGWGALILHAAKYYGACAQGITLSEPQAEVARERIGAADLADKCRVDVCDYRELDGTSTYNKIVSVGMIEHVGEKLLPEYFAQAWKLLEPGGVFLNHGIAYSATYRRKGESFVDRYVFPDGEILPIYLVVRIAEATGFEVRDVESLREHYELTLHHWVKRLEANVVSARQITSDLVYRIWRLYMAGSAHAFRSGRLNLYQTLLAKTKRGQSGLPLTRADWYQ